MNQSLKPSVLSASVSAFASLGDSFLYTVLPVNALQMNVPVVWIGFLLSINRFVRLIANPLFAYLFNRFGFKLLTIMAALLSVLTTFSYSIATGILVWIIARITWGLCFSALRMSAISYALENNKRGFSLGLSKGLQELGPVLSLILGPLLLKWINPSTSFFVLALISVPAIIISFYLPELKHKRFDYVFSFKIVPSFFNVVTFWSSFFVQGILVITLAKLFAYQNLSLIQLTAIAGFYLAYRRICTVITAPAGGLLADKWGLDKIYLCATVFTITGLFLISIGFVEAGIIIAFTFHSIAGALGPGNAVAESSNHLRTISANSTWNDLGAATGTLLAGFVVEANLSLIFFIASIVLSVVAILYFKSTSVYLKQLIKWK